MLSKQKDAAAHFWHRIETEKNVKHLFPPKKAIDSASDAKNGVFCIVVSFNDFIKHISCTSDYVFGRIELSTCFSYDVIPWFGWRGPCTYTLV